MKDTVKVDAEIREVSNNFQEKLYVSRNFIA